MTRRLGLGLALLVALCCAAPLASAEDASTGDAPSRDAPSRDAQKRDASLRLERALDAYARGLESEDADARLAYFRAAERDFAALLESGVRNPDLYVNLGNAALLGERPGASILAYRRALRLDPDHRAALVNLAHARATLPGWVPRPEAAGVLDTFFFWHRVASPAQRASLAALAFFVAASLLAASQVTGPRWLRSLALLPGLLWLAALASLAVDRFGGAPEPAVVTAAESVARAADSVHAPPRFARPLPAGVEVSILEHRAGWKRIALADGREAWLAASAVVPVDAAESSAADPAG